MSDPNKLTLNSTNPSSAHVVGGVYHLTPPAPADGQSLPLQQDSSGNLLVNVAVGGGGAGGNVNITGINGSAPALTNPLPVELSDGTNPVGTAGNPLSVNVITGGGSNASVGATGATAPTSATEIGVIDGTGKLQGASASNPVRVDPTGTTTQPISATSLPLPTLAATSTKQSDGSQKSQVVDGSGNVITSTGNALDVNVKTPNPLPISAASLPLPTLAATSTKQSDGSQKSQIVDGSGNVVTSTGNALDVNIKTGITNPLPVTGTITAVTSITNQVDTNLKQVAGANTSTAASGVQKVGVVGNAGAIFDGATAAAVPANAVQAGMRGSTTVPTAVTDGQLVGARSDKYGNQVAVLNAPRDLIATAILNSNSSTTVSFIGAGAAGVFNDIITLIITNESSTATIATLTDNGSGGNTYKFALAGNGGIVINFPTPLPQGTAAAAWQVLNSAGVALDWVAVYAKNK